MSEIRKHSVIHENHVSKVITHESQHSIKTVNKTIINVNVTGQIDLKNETSRLSEISKMLIQESENLSKRLQEEIKQLQLNNNNMPPAESIWETVTVLNNLIRNSKNETEINQIRQILEKVTDEMRLKVNGQQMFDIDLDKLMKELQNFANNNGKLNSTADNQELSRDTKQSNTSISLKDNRGEVGRNESAVIKDEVRQLEKSVQPKESSLSLGVGSLASLFSSMSANHDDLKHAKKIVSESLQAEKILTNLSKGN